MSCTWRKLGQLYDPGPTGDRHPKLRSHAANPLPVHLEGEIYRVFFSARDERNRSSVGAVDVDIGRACVVTEYAHPFFVHGPPGSFYADGVSIGNCYTAGGSRYMLFMGWQAPVDGHWFGTVGRLIVSPDLTLRLGDDRPHMGLDETDPISLSYPWVLSASGGGFRMWYGSTINWDAGNGEMLHIIKQASSSDGHHWQRHGPPVPYAIGTAQAFSRPTVIESPGGGLDMWFSYRSGSGERYRIGYARSRDGVSWQLDLAASGIDVSPSGWDSEMIEYPYVFVHNGRRYMLYNGNRYGGTGFGLAVAADD